MTQQGLQHASLEAYLSLLKNKGADSENLARRRELLGKLLPFLDTGPIKGMHFRNAIDEALMVIDKNDWPFFLAIVRDFYHFWVDDFKAIAALHMNGAFNVAPVLPQTPEGTLQDMWARLEMEKFVIAEKWPANAYKAALQNDSLKKEVVEIRLKLAQLLLLQLRKTEGKNALAYRLAVESMLPVFNQKETAELFIQVVREFYHFWMGDPKAANHMTTSNIDHPHTLWLE